MIYGIDIANHQEGFDLDRAIDTGKLDFAIFKASEYGWRNGHDGIDWTFDGWASVAERRGLRFGAYMFARTLNWGSVEDQVSLFVRAVGSHMSRCVLCLDFESTSYSSIQGDPDLALAFLREIKRQTGKTALFYTSAGEVWYNDYSQVRNEGFPLWGAYYGDGQSGHAFPIRDPWGPSRGWGAWGDRPAIYQYGDGELIGWDIDVNVGYLSLEDWDRLAGGEAPRPQPQPSPEDPIEVDGWGGRLTISKLQSQLGSPYVDGRLSGQLRSNYEFFEGFNEDRIDFDGGSGESWCVRELQRRVGADSDGVWGPETSAATQRKLQSWGYDIGPDGVDSYFGHQSMRALQVSLNDGRWKR